MKVHESVCLRKNNPGTKTNILLLYVATYFTPSIQSLPCYCITLAIISKLEDNQNLRNEYI